MSGPVPARVDGTAKAALLCLIDDAVDAGWTLSRACAALELDRGRAWRCQQRRAGAGLMTPARAGTRSTGSWSGRRRRSWRCSTSGAT